MRNEIDKRMSGHPSEEWSAMDQYRKDLKEHEDYMESIKPDPDDFENNQEYEKKLAEWKMALFCDAPNKPGYYRANND